MATAVEFAELDDPEVMTSLMMLVGVCGRSCGTHPEHDRGRGYLRLWFVRRLQ